MAISGDQSYSIEYENECLVQIYIFFKDLTLFKYKLTLITNYFSFFQNVLTKINILWVFFVVLTFERQSYVPWAGLELIN